MNVYPVFDIGAGWDAHKRAPVLQLWRRYLTANGPTWQPADTLYDSLYRIWGSRYDGEVMVRMQGEYLVPVEDIHKGIQNALKGAYPRGTHESI